MTAGPRLWLLLTALASAIAFGSEDLPGPLPKDMAPVDWGSVRADVGQGTATGDKHRADARAPR